MTSGAIHINGPLVERAARAAMEVILNDVSARRSPRWQSMHLACVAGRIVAGLMWANQLTLDQVLAKVSWAVGVCEQQRRGAVPVEASTPPPEDKD